MERGKLNTLRAFEKTCIREIVMTPKWLDHGGKLKGYPVDGVVKEVNVVDIVGIA